MLLPVRLDTSKIGDKKAGYETNHIIGVSWMYLEEVDVFWNRLIPEWFENGDLVPLDYQVIDGLDVMKVNAVYDNYAVGKPQGKVHVHP